MANGHAAAASFLSKVGTTLATAAILGLLSGGVWIGNIETRLEAAETEVEKAEDDHDKIIKIEADQEQIKEDIEEIKDDQQKILDAVNELIRESHRSN